MEFGGASISIHFNPLLPDAWFAAAIGAAIVLFVLSSLKARNGLILRTVTLAVFILALLNPSLLEEQRQPVKDVAVVVVDQSPSQKMGEREKRSAEALTHLKNKLGSRDDLELRIIEAPSGAELASETLLFEALDKTLADVPLQRRAGVIFITDGQIHDVPQNDALYESYGPVHALLSGDKKEKDRQVIVTEAPAYGLVGQTITVKYRIEDTDNVNKKTSAFYLTRPGALADVYEVPVAEELSIDIPIEHAGQNVFELCSDILPGEITKENNHANIIVNGVRDRLKVLLVSGKPHAGGRTWRDLLTSDPGVDLVHFTILRDPSKLDATPQNELSLIAFPFRELFEVKLYDFDLIIFDRYRLNRILPEAYFDNIVRYVEEGGALLEASGPAFASQDSLYFTNLMNVLPGAPTGEVIEQVFRPAVTQLGKIHPVTKDLGGIGTENNWGQWLRQVAITTEDGDVLMNGVDENPLLVLNRVKDGRTAQIASDNLWLWARGYDGGGPHGELLRRVVHWLMKEPELDEQALDVTTSGDQITIEARNMNADSQTVLMSRPDKTQEELTLEQKDDGVLQTKTQADQLGIYSFQDSEYQKRFAIIGELNPPELTGAKTTAEKLAPLLEASGGGALWLSEDAQPDIRLSSANANRFAGRGWIGLRKNNDYVVEAVKSRPLLPEWAAALMLLMLVTLSWWKEGRSV